MAAYADVDDMIARYSPRHLRDLVSDDGRITELELQTDTKILTALRTATGQVNASAMQGDRYTLEMLEGLNDSGSTYYNQESGEYLKDLTCRIAYWFLWQRKPWDDDASSARRQAEADYKEALKLLRHGTEIFTLAPAKEAGKPEGVGVQQVDLVNMWSQIPRGRFYPINRNIDTDSN